MTLWTKNLIANALKRLAHMAYIGTMNTAISHKTSRQLIWHCSALWDVPGEETDVMLEIP